MSTPVKNAVSHVGEGRIAHERLLTRGLRVSPQTVRSYLPTCLGHGRHRRMPSRRWRMLLRHQARMTVACDFRMQQLHGRLRRHAPQARHLKAELRQPLEHLLRLR